MKSTNLLLTYIPDVATKYLQYIWSDTLRKFNNLNKGKSEDVLKEFANWPRGYDSYYESVTSIVDVGISSPHNAIEALLSIVPSKDPESIYGKLAVSMAVDNNDIIHKEFFDILLYFLFADSVSQLMTYDKQPQNPRVLNACVALLKKDYGKNYESKYRSFLDNTLITLLKQCSVVTSCFAVNDSFYKQSISTLSASLGEKDPTIRSRVLTLYRLLRHPSDKALNFINEFLLPQLSDKKMASNLSFIYDSIKCALLQVPQSSSADLAELNKIFSKPDSCIKKTAFEFQAIILARIEDVTPKKCAELFEKIPKETENSSILQAFLNLIRGPYFYPTNEFWEYGEKNGQYMLILEKGQLLFPTQQQSLNDKNCFCSIFLEHIADKMDSSSVATKILFNLFSRNLIETVSCLLDYYKGLPINDKKIGPFLNALTLIFDNSIGFVEGAGNDIQENINILRTYMKPLMEQKLHTYVPPENSHLSCACKTISVQECPQTISPDAIFTPNIGSLPFKERIKASRNKIMDLVSESKSLNIKNEIKVVYKFSKSSTKASDRTAMYLFSLIYQIINKTDANEEYFLPIVNAAICSHYELAFFSLYALQIFYINKPFTVQPILSAINRVLAQTIETPCTYTLLNLLYQLISLPRMVVKEEDKEWFNDWTTKLQALLLINLASPYVEVRDAAILTMQRLDTICDDYGIDVTITSLLNQFSAEISRRVSHNLSLILHDEKSLENVYFDDAARSSSLLIYPLFLSEYANVLARTEIRNVIQAVWKLNVYRFIEFPIKNKDQVQVDDNLLTKNILLIALLHKLLPLSPQAADSIQYDDHLLNPTYYINVYGIESSIIIKSENEPDVLANRVSFLETVIPSLVGLLNQEWALITLKVMAFSSSVDLAATLISKLIGSLPKPGNDPKLFIQNAQKLISIIEIIVQSPDFILTVISQGQQIRQLYSEFIRWCHNALAQFNIKFKSDLTLVDPSPENFTKAQHFIQSYCKIINALSQSFSTLFDPGTSGSLRGFIPPGWVKPEYLWPNEERRHTFELFISLYQNKNTPKQTSLIVKEALMSLTESVVIFNTDNYKLTSEILKVLLDIEASGSSNVLSGILTRQPSLFDYFNELALSLPVSQGFYFFRAISKQFIGIVEQSSIELSEYDTNANLKCVENSGKLLLLSLIFLSSNHEESRKIAFNLLKRIIPIFCAFNEPENIKPSSIINDYMAEHKIELSGLAFPPSQSQLFDFANLLAQNMPFLSHSVFQETFLFYLAKKGAIDSQIITNLFNVVAPFARLIDLNSKNSALPDNYFQPSTYTPFTIITNLISKFQVISKSNHQTYTRIFSEICYNRDNIDPLLQIFVMIAHESSKIAVQTVCLTLVQSQTASVLQILTQPFTFGSWFNEHIASTKLVSENSYTPYNWIDLSFSVIHEILLTNVGLVYPYIHLIIHSCLLFLGEGVNHPQNLSMLEAIFNALHITFPITKDFSICFTSKVSSSSTPIRDIVYIIREKLQEILPEAITSWTEEALQWITGCGKLGLAYKSGIIYSYLLNDVAFSDAYQLMYALDVVLYSCVNQKSQLPHEIIHNELLPYIHGVLRALSTITKVAVKNGAGELMTCIYLFISSFIDIVTYDEESSRIALQILLTFVNSKIAITTEQILPNLLSIAKMLPLTFNDSNVTTFLTSIIYNFPASTTHSVKVLSLAMLLPVIFSVVSAFHSIDPYSTFVSDDVVINTFECAKLIGESEFAGDAKYTEIFFKYFGETSLLLESMSPEQLLDVITAEIWRSDPEEVSNFSKYYFEMAKHNKVPAIRSATFSTIISFINTSPTKETYTKFIDFIRIAIDDNSQKAKALLKLVNEKDISENDSLSVSIPPTQTEPTPNELKNLSEKIRKITCNIIPQFEIGGDVTILNHKWTVPMIPLCENSTDLCQDQINSIKSVKYQPYNSQLQFWSTIQTRQPSTETHKSSQPTLFDMFAHSKANTSQGNNKQNTSKTQLFEPQNFIIKDEELDTFEQRLIF